MCQTAPWSFGSVLGYLEPGEKKKKKSPKSIVSGLISFRVLHFFFGKGFFTALQWARATEDIKCFVTQEEAGLGRLGVPAVV